MLFSTDNQTLQDLNIFSRGGGDSIYDLFNRTLTRGGAVLLEDMFRHPLSDAQQIRARGRLIESFTGKEAGFPFRLEWFDAAETYLAHTDERTMLVTEEKTLGRRLSGLLTEDPMYKTIQHGIIAFTGLAKELYRLEAGGSGGPYEQDAGEVRSLLSDGPLSPVVQLEQDAARLSQSRLAELDRLLRFRERHAVEKVLRHLYALDVYTAVARVARDRGFHFPEVQSPGEAVLRLEAVYHPLLKDPVPNTLTLSAEANLVFLTGANMAGKSTLMKTLGVAMYLAHLGFPVPARSMVFTVLDGIYTTINLADNLNAGASHFYAEVLRIKKIAKEISLGRSLFVIFDELFRGTNVKDAEEATIAVTDALARKRHCLFVISTHIVEAGEALMEKNACIRFVYLPTTMAAGQPVYSYQLQEGITADRHGMVIIRNAGILDLLNRKKGGPS